MTGRVADTGGVALTALELVDELIARVPESASRVDEHLADFEGEVLVHLLTDELRRLAIAWFDEGQREPLSRLLAVMARGMREGDDYVVNAVAVSFVEDTCVMDPAMQPFINSWPAALREEAETQRRAALARAADPSGRRGRGGSGRPTARRWFRRRGPRS